MNRIVALSPERVQEAVALLDTLAADGARDLLSMLAEYRQTGFKLRGSRPRVHSESRTPLVFQNVSGEKIPPFGCIQVTDTKVEFERTLYIGDKPSDEWGIEGMYVFNGPREVEADGFGSGSPDLDARAITKHSNITAGARMRPEQGTWKLYESAGGLYQCVGEDAIGEVVGDGTEKIVRIQRAWPEFIRWFQSPSGGIPVRSGTALGNAVCTAYELTGSSSATLSALTDSDAAAITDTVHNAAENEAVGNSVFIQATLIDGRWVANWEECVT
ncbi:MAG: hypothetical protein AAFU85_02145 [Planctomycetota bacterium]